MHSAAELSEIQFVVRRLLNVRETQRAVCSSVMKQPSIGSSSDEDIIITRTFNPRWEVRNRGSKKETRNESSR